MVPTLDEMLRIRCGLFKDIYDWLARDRIEPGAPELAMYSNCEYVEENIQMEAAVAVEAAWLRSPAHALAPEGRLAIRELAAVPLMASVIHHGRFQDVGDAFTALYTWVGENGYTPAGAYREIHLFGRENDLSDLEAVTVEMQLPVERR